MLLYIYYYILHTLLYHPFVSTTKKMLIFILLEIIYRYTESLLKKAAFETISNFFQRIY